MSNARVKKLDEKRSQEVREIAARAENKHCAECHQRGPTYADMTTGAFVCTTCSGLLRGLNPPHRVKSISMATFTVEDVNMLREKGNDHCRAVWLGLYDGQGPRPDDGAMKDFLITKYERKRWYVSEREINRQDKIFEQASTARKMQLQQPSPPSTIPQQSSDQLVDLFATDPVTAPVDIFQAHFDQPFQPMPPPPHVDRKTSVSSIPSMVVGGVQPKQAVEHFAPPPNNGNFAAFADFDAAFAAASTQKGPPDEAAFIAPIKQNSTTPHINPFSAPVLIQPVRASNFVTPSTLLDADIPPALNQVKSNGQNPKSVSETPTDKYAALADLDSMFGSTGLSDNGTNHALPDMHSYQPTHQSGSLFGSKLLAHDNVVRSGEIDWGNSPAPWSAPSHTNHVAPAQVQQPTYNPIAQQHSNTSAPLNAAPVQQQQQHAIGSPNWNPFL